MMDDESFRDYLLSAMRSASLRCKLADNELTTIGIALRTGMMDAHEAARCLYEQNLLWLMTERAESVAVSAAANKAFETSEAERTKNE